MENQASGAKIFDRVVNNDQTVYKQIRSGSEITKGLAKDLVKERGIKRLNLFFENICRHKDAVTILRAIRPELNRVDGETLLNNVAAFFAKNYREGSVDGLGHLYPLIIEAQPILARKHKSK